MPLVDIEQLKSQFLSEEFDSKDFVIDPQKAITAARVSGAQLPEYIDIDHPKLQASHAYLASLASGRRLPIDFPKIGGMGIDGGKAVTSHAPVPLGQPLTGRTHLHDIYDKTGRSGRMIFLVARMEIYDAQQVLLATTDSRMVIREKPTK